MNIEQARVNMIEQQIRPWDVLDPQVLDLLFVVKRDQSLTPKEIIKHCREFLTGYKVPSQIEFRSELPKTNVGKILRRELRDGH